MIFLLWLLLPIQAQEDITSETLSTSTAIEQFTDALKKFNSVQRNDSQPIFSELVLTLDNAETPLSAEEAEIYVESLKYLAVLEYPDKTEAHFEKLIRFDPTYSLEVRDLPPKIAAVFEQLRGRLVGTLRISTAGTLNDAGFLPNTELWVDGKRVGTVVEPNQPFTLLAGSRTVEIRKANFESFTQDVVVPAAGEASLAAMLNRSASDLVLVTIPADVTVFLDDVEMGTTNAPAPAGYTDILAESGLTPADAGSFVINGVQPGTYRIRLEKACFKPRLIEEEITENKRWTYAPQAMTPAASHISVEGSGDATGILFLDNTRLGILPVTNQEICPGTYQLKVKFSDGDFIKNVHIEDGEHLQITAEPLPSMVWFGIQENNEGKPPADVGEWLSQLKSWSLETIPADSTALPIDPFNALFDRRVMDPQDALAFTRNRAAGVYVAARVVRKKMVIRYLEVAFWSPLSDSIRTYAFDYREIDRFRELLNRIDGKPELTIPWLGLQAGKLRDVPGLRVFEVHARGPLAGKLQAGDQLLSLNGNPLRMPSELPRIAAGPVSIESSRGTLEVEPMLTIAEIPFDPKSVCPQAMLALLEKYAKYGSDEMTRSAAAFNLARYQFFLGDYQKAFDAFSTMTISSDLGINQGTLYFYQGLCFRRLKLTGEAGAAFQEVLNFPNATLLDAYGPKAAFWAESEVKNTQL